MWTWIDKLPTLPLTAAAVALLLAPFHPMPHAVEKLMMLANGTLTRPLDIFDLVFHLLPATVLAAKLVRSRRRS
jgi:hypothetical protein